MAQENFTIPGHPDVLPGEPGQTFRNPPVINKPAWYPGQPVHLAEEKKAAPPAKAATPPPPPPAAPPKNDGK